MEIYGTIGEEVYLGEVDEGNRYLYSAGGCKGGFPD